MEFRLLGSVQIQRTSGQLIQLTRRKERLALAILLLQPGQVVTADRLIDLLWMQTPPAGARTSLQTVMSRIRAALRSPVDGDPGEPVQLLARGDGYLLRARPDSVDLQRFRALVGQARTISDPEARSARLASALDLWRGPALADAANDLVRAQVCVDLEEARFAAISDRIDADLAMGRHAEVISELSSLVAEHPLRENLHGQLMVALYRCGRRADALDAYRRARKLLAAELGLDPGPRLRELESAILADAHDLHLGVDAPSRSTSGQARPAADTGPLKTGPQPPSQAAETPVTPAELPPDLGSFVGRTAYLHELDSWLAEESNDGPPRPATTIAVIAGAGGVGKTALAVRWAHHIRRRFPDGQLYVNLRGFDLHGTSMSSAEALHGFLGALHAPGRNIPAGLPAQIGMYRSLLADKRMLIVLDNARDANQVRPLLPGAPGCLVVVTSRNPLAGLVAAEGAHPVVLDLLSTQESRDLLARRLGADRIEAEPAAVDEIIMRSARLPLALAVVAARAATNRGFPMTALAGELRDARAGLDAFDGGDPVTQVRTVFFWSYRTLSVPAARLFRLLSLHAGPDITAAAAASLAGTGVRQVRTQLAELAATQLIAEHVPGRFTFHDLLRVYAAELVHEHDTGPDRQAAFHRMFDHYLHSAYAAHGFLNRQYGALMTLAPPAPAVTPENPVDDEEALAWFTAERHALPAAALLAADVGFDAHAWQLAQPLASFFRDHRGTWRGLAADQNIAVQHAALAAARRLGDVQGQAHAYRGLGGAYLHEGRLDDCQSSLGHALKLFAELDDRAGQAHVHLSLAVSFDAQGRHGDALGHAESALELYGADSNTAGQAKALNAIGWLRARLGEYRQTLVHCHQALVLFEQIGDRLGAAHTWDSVGYAHHHLGEYSQAIAGYQEALDRYRAVGEQYYQAVVLNRIGDIHYAANRPEAAGDACRDAGEIMAQLGLDPNQ
jgi:DNA-binding SARP family transcriptional activator